VTAVEARAGRPVEWAARVVGEVNQRELFRVVAAMIHYGATPAAAVSEAPQVIVPPGFDQFRFARHVDQLGIGGAHAAGALTADTLLAALHRAHGEEVAERARAITARRLIAGGA
jgi:vancomycin aglycone glucosyltransferase